MIGLLATVFIFVYLALYTKKMMKNIEKEAQEESSKRCDSSGSLDVKTDSVNIEITERLDHDSNLTQDSY